MKKYIMTVSSIFISLFVIINPHYLFSEKEDQLEIGLVYAKKANLDTQRKYLKKFLENILIILPLKNY